MTDDLFENEHADSSELQDESEAVEADAQSGLQFADEPFVSRTIDSEEPEIGEQESAIIDAWWATYDGLTDLDEIIRHLNAFVQTHPGLLKNLLMQDDVLLALGERLIEAGRASDYIELLQHLRRDCPDAYMQAFGYYDLEIIRYKVATRDLEGLEDYLNWFKEYPDSDPDNLFGLIDFLMATECDQPLVRLLEDTYYPVCRSEKVIGGGEIVDPLVLAYCVPYLDQGRGQADLESLSARLKEIRIPLNDEWYRPDYLGNYFEEILGDLDSAFFSTFKDAGNIHEYYRTVTHNFMGWIHEEKRFSWMKAHFYRTMVNRYLVYVIPEGKRPKQPFVFSRKLLDTTISQVARRLFSLDATKTLGSLNAVYWFAEYLLEQEAISKQECTNVKNWCEELWEITIPQFRGSTIEARAFDRFPQ